MTNLLQNPSFEGDTYEPQGQMALVLPKGWGVGWLDDGKLWRVDYNPQNPRKSTTAIYGKYEKHGPRARPNMSACLKPEILVIARVAPYLDPIRIAEGDKSLTMFKQWGTLTAWVYQTVSVTPGVRYRLKSSAHAWDRIEQDPPDAHYSHGIGRGGFFALENGSTLSDDQQNARFRSFVIADGSLDPLNSQVTYFSTGAFIYNIFHELPVFEFSVTGTTVTVGGMIDNLWGDLNSNYYWDNFVLEAVEELPPPPPPSTGRGRPRVQYERTAILVSPKMSDVAGSRVALTAGQYHPTITWSADDGGIGDLDYRKVLALRPADWPDGGLNQAWFDRYYPGVQMEAIDGATDDELLRRLADVLVRGNGGPVEPPTPPPPGPAKTKRSKIGAHVLGMADGTAEIIQAGPSVVKFAGDWGSAGMCPPGTFIVGRQVLKTDDDAQQIKARGLTPASGVQDFIYGREHQISTYKANPLIIYWEGHNEPVWTTEEQMAWYAQFEIERMKAMEREGLKCVIGNFSSGTPEMSLWPAFLPACQYALEHGHVLGLHEYSRPWLWFMTGLYQMQQENCVNPKDLRRLWGWTILRYRQVYDQLLTPAGLGKLPLVITECGIDGLSNPAPDASPATPWKGQSKYWKAHRDDIGFDYDKQTYPLPAGVAWNDDMRLFYLAQLQWLDRQLQEDEFVIGATLFTVGNVGGGWADFDVCGEGGFGTELAAYIQSQKKDDAGGTVPDTLPKADRFDAPVGTAQERDSAQLWPGAWIDATGYAVFYELGCHTGADLNLNSPVFDADAHSPVVAAANGRVVFAGELSTWGNLIVVYHDLADGSDVWTRYGHVENLQVKVGDVVQRGQQMACVGNAGGRFPYHLHFDCSVIDLGKNPGDWPGQDRARVLRDYLNPLAFLAGHHPHTESQVALAVGLHDLEGGVWMKQNGKTGICVDCVQVVDSPVDLDYTELASAGIQVFVRLNYGYADGTGTLPMANQLLAFEKAVVETMKRAKGVKAFIYGNEPNNVGEWPAGGSITAELYTESYNRVWWQCPKDVLLGPAALDPYFGPGSNNRTYWQTILMGIDGADVLFLHAKTQSNDPGEVLSTAKFGDDPLKWQYLHLRTIETSLEIVPQRFQNLPVYVTELNPQRVDATHLGWVGGNTAWVQQALAYFQDWNKNGHQKIHGVALYRWDHDAWALVNHPELLGVLWISSSS